MAAGPPLHESGFLPTSPFLREARPRALTVSWNWHCSSRSLWTWTLRGLAVLLWDALRGFGYGGQKG
ncbi:hypothetical protein Y032_0058g2939 [Ancylostoma ceylanicum]|uniref:Uncharacterized protein n=1 Tax=Ancylostoma ceylanicum TaxID=53326 RepID=A0A016U4E5_9BILA|nr:hypothetical protein Y032_0058g2939 [Ancylostoma ceylanicum]